MGIVLVARFAALVAGAPPRRHNDIHLEPDELGREIRQPFELSLGITALNDEVLPLHIAEVAEPVQECLEQVRPGATRLGISDAVR